MAPKPPVGPLPDPTLSPPCMACGYSLQGLQRPVPCPECGAISPFAHVTVFGVPSGHVILPTWRLVLILIFGALALFSPQILIMLAFITHWSVSVAAALLGLAFIVWFVLSTPRGMKGGSSRLDFVDGAIAIYPLLNQSPTPEAPARRLDTGTIQLRGDERVDIQRVGPLWTKVRLIPTRPERRDVPDSIRIGMRCPVELEPIFRQGAERAIAAARTPNSPPPPHSPAPPSPHSPPHSPADSNVGTLPPP